MKTLAKFIYRLPRLSSILFLLNFPIALFAQFTAGRLVVLQAGDGSLPLSSNGNSILFKEYSTSGTPGFSMSVPSTGTNALIIRGSANSEGHLSLSEDATCIVFGAYLQSLPYASPLNSPAASTLNRGVGLVFASGAYSLGAIGNGPFANGDIRGASATTSLNLWASSSSAGASYYGTNSTPGNVQNSKTNLRSIQVFNQQLYISSQSTAGTPSVIGIYAIGSGTPVSAPQTVSVVLATGLNSQPCQFYFNAANTICYVADSRNSASGGIQKWINSAGTWSLAYTLSTGGNPVGAMGVVADFSGNSPKVYATTSESVGNRLVAINDLGPASTASTLATASTANTIFRGLCFSPGTIPCNSPAVISITTNSASCSNDTLVLSANVVGNAPITYSWSGSGNFSTTSASITGISHASSGTYSLMVSNACGTSSAAVNLNITPSPTLQVNSSSICSGGIATLVASGATTYTWSSGSNASTFTVNPATTSVYTVMGTSSACVSAPFVATVNVISSISLSSTSSIICSGSSATLQVSGASSYTWNTNQTGSLLIVSPLASTTYTVIGSAPGCPNTASITANIVVNPLPEISFTLPFSEVCETETLFQFNASPGGGSFSGPGMNGNQFSPSLAGLGTHTIVYTFTDSSSCTNSMSHTISVVACTGFQNESQTSECAIYPNPVRESLTIESPSDKAVLSARILNCYGQLIKCFDIKGKTFLLVQDLPPGLYWLEINSETKHFYFKLLKE